MGKRKIFLKSDIAIPEVAHFVDAQGSIEITAVLPPVETVVVFGRNPTTWRSFDFSHWYGCGFDPIVYACQSQIKRFLLGQDAVLEVSTIAGYCQAGLRIFLSYLVFRATALDQDIAIGDINRDMIDGYLKYLIDCGYGTTTQKSYYTNTKPVLNAIGRRRLFSLIQTGDAAMFPSNPFPNSNRKKKGETALPRAQRQAFTEAVKRAVMPIWDDEKLLTGELLSYALLIVALHTGRNTTPLLEMDRDCLRAHPKDNTVFLVLWKRRGPNTSKVVLRSENTQDRLLEVTPTVRANVASLIQRIISRTENLRKEVDDSLRGRVWLHRSRNWAASGEVIALTDKSIECAVRNLVAKYQLIDTDGEPLRINVSRLRKTFGNRIFEILDGDLETTAIALGNTPRVAGTTYLQPTEESRRNWRFMGEVLVEELLAKSIGDSYKLTPMGRCSDAMYGQYAPKKEGATCTSFLNCLRCRHYVVTGEDLYRLFSFYFRVYSERERMDTRRWAREYAYIPRLIDDYIVAEGLRRKAFNVAAVKQARERARIDPHPFWAFDLIPSLEVFS